MSHTRIVRRRVRVTAVTALVGLLLAACGGESSNEPAAAAESEPAATEPAAATSESDAAPEFGLVSPEAASELAVDVDVTVIDVRTPEEFGEGHLDGAVMIDFYADTFAEQMAALDPDGTYLLYCRSGNRSGQATTLMAELGFERVYDLDGGVIAWGSEGRPLVR